MGESVSTPQPRQLRTYQVEATSAVHDAWNDNRNRVSVVLPTGTGKALADSTLVPTPRGLTRHGDLRVGDEVFHISGKPTRVTHIHPQGDIDVWKVSFTDGASVVASLEHLWRVQNHMTDTVELLSTRELLDVKFASHGAYTRSVPLSEPVQYGADSVFTPEHPHGGTVEERVAYLRSVVGDQPAPLFTTTSIDTARTVQQVVWTLGGLAQLARDEDGNYRVIIRLRREVSPWGLMCHPRRAIVSVTHAGIARCQCITVESPDGLYLAGEEHIVTHNSTVIANVAARARADKKKVLLLAHRTELLDQMAGAVKAVDPQGQDVGIVAADRDEANYDIVAASFQTLARSPKRLAALGTRDVILADECFPAGTLLSSGTRIEDVRVGDVIESWDETRRTVTESVVEKITAAVPSALIRVHFEDGTTTACTPGHPFLTADHTWTSAKNLEGKYAVRTGQGCGSREQKALVRVDRVEVLEPGRDGSFGGVCPDGRVYNLEVNGTHTYLIEHGTVVHNCHHISAPTYLKVLEDLGAMDDSTGVRSCGFTATMYRDDGRALGDVWKEVVYEKDLIWAIDNGFLIAPKGKTIALPELNKLAQIKTLAGDYKQNDLAEVMGASVDSTVDAILRHCPSAAMIVFAVSVEHARVLAEKLTASGIQARDVTGGHQRDYRESAYADFREGRIDCLVTVQVLTEGADFPRCDTVVMARPTRSKVLATQIIGRAVRPYTDPVTGLAKTNATVLDLTGVVRDVKLVSLTDLFPASDHQYFDDSGADRTEDEEFLDTLLGRPKKKERNGSLELEDIDLLGRDGIRSSRKVVWLRAGPLNTMQDEIAFMPLKNGGEYMFLYPPVSRMSNHQMISVGHVSKHGVVSFLMGPDGQPIKGTLTQAMDAAEKMTGPQNYITDRAGWRHPSVTPSEKQIMLGKNLGIPDAEKLSRGQLSDRLSERFAIRVFADIIQKYPM